jgi:hypothetical protein
MTGFTPITTSVAALRLPVPPAPALRFAHRAAAAAACFAVYDLKAYKASIKPQCTNGKKGGTSSFSMKFSPEGPCKECDTRYCKKVGSGCTCTLPSGYSVTKDVAVYTKPQKCSALAKVTRWEDGSVTMSPNNLPYDDMKCPGGALHQPKGPADVATLTQVRKRPLNHPASVCTRAGHGALTRSPP